MRFLASSLGLIVPCILVYVFAPAPGTVVCFFLLLLQPLGVLFLIKDNSPWKEKIRQVLSFLLVTGIPVIFSVVQGEISFFQWFFFYVLALSCCLFCYGIGRTTALLCHQPLLMMPSGWLVLLLLVVGVWAAPWFAIEGLDQFWLGLNPLAALAGLLHFDWLRTGELYWDSPLGSGEPFRYPNWQELAFWFSVFGLLLLVVTEIWVRGKRKINPLEEGME